ncbi:MAG TPA: hypothetical protein DCO72_07540 [Ruminococcus sp.]|nr:hypothetical protein [Ruminococcus sp.]
MRKYNRLRAFAVAVMMAVCSAPVVVLPVQAETEYPDFSYLGAVGSLSEYQTQFVAESIYNALENHSTGADLSCSEPIFETVDNIDAVRSIYATLITSYEIGMLASKSGLGYQAQYNQTTKNFEMSKFKFSYIVSDSKYNKTYANVVSQLDEISALVNDDWSDIEKALFLHEYITMHFCYDNNFKSYDTEREAECHTAYGMLTYGMGVCDGYANLYSILLQREGILAPLVTSVALEHAWNAVYLNGEWFYVDVTWDDDDRRTGSTRHSNFLKDFEGMQETEHFSEDWSTYYGLNIDALGASDMYSNAFWNDSICAVQYHNGVWVFAQKDEENQQTARYRWIDVHTGDCGEYFTDTEMWNVINKTSYYLGSFTVIGVYEDYLIYTAPNAIMYYNGSENFSLYDLTEDERNTGRIYGMHIEGDTLYYELSASPNAKGDTYGIDLSKVEFAPLELPAITETTITTETTTTTMPATTTTITTTTTTAKPTTSTTTTTTKATTTTMKPTTETTSVTTTETTKKTKKTTATTETTTTTAKPETTTAMATTTTAKPETTTAMATTTTAKPETTTAMATTTTAKPETTTAMATTTIETTITQPVTTEPPVLSGDIDGDEVVSVADLIVFQKYLHGITTISEQQFTFADLNDDGAVNVIDLALLKKYLINQ